MAILVVNSVCRYWVRGQMGVRPWACVVDMQIDTTGSVLTRPEAIATVGRDIVDNWADHIAPLQTATTDTLEVGFIDLDSADGTTGTITAGNTRTLPVAGSVADQFSTRALAVLVKKAVVSARGSRAGRMYVPGISEDDSTNGQLTVAALGIWQAALDAFFDGIEDTGGAPQRKPVVVHAPGLADAPDDQVYIGTYSDVENYSVQEVFATQRRRQRG